MAPEEISPLSAPRATGPGGGQWIRLAIAVVAVLAGAGIAGFLTGLGIDDWYPGLRKPSWTPPDAVFGPVWTVLYVSMAVAAWLVWRKLPFRGGPPLALFMTQLLLNVAWPGVFFALHRTGLAALEIAALWLAIAATIRSFRRVSKPAAWLLVPYLAWTTYAGALTIAIWRLNG